MKISIIVAIASNGVIGNEDGIPWHYSSDLNHFRETTIGHPVIMGRQTFDNIQSRSSEADCWSGRAGAVKA